MHQMMGKTLQEQHHNSLSAIMSKLSRLNANFLFVIYSFKYKPGERCRDNLQPTLKVKIRTISDHELIIFKAMGPPVVISSSSLIYSSTSLPSTLQLMLAAEASQHKGKGRRGIFRKLQCSLLSSWSLGGAQGGLQFQPPPTMELGHFDCCDLQMTKQLLLLLNP